MKNITLAIDEKVLASVRRYAVSNKTTVNALVREALGSIAKRGRSSEKAWDALFDLTDKEGAEVGERTWTRDDLYVR
jgi:Arc/MetJ family transcription regulator